MGDGAERGALAEGETFLFVYGTLKRGQSNHARLHGERCFGLAWLEGACLYDLGPFPMAIAAPGRVAGELYAVSLALLPALDAFEGCPRLYQRHWLALAAGPAAWVYLGQPRQVRHARRLPAGAWPPPPEASALEAVALSPSAGKPNRRRLARAMAWALPLLGAYGLGGARAAGFDTLGACQAWRHSSGLARLELANAIGAAHALTKRQAFVESTPETPVALYDPLDIARVCGRP
ncbi:MAG: gamma-glutamylcyclotransferase family protein [Cyanobacteriota bacterium]|nr:gamma-glutamylcyclotransferase family protein [Cyanobacteriota bacterium]